MQQTAQQHLSIDDYLQGELDSDLRHEYIDGQVHAMAGAGERHNLIAGNLFSTLHQHSRGTPCRPFIADMKLYIENSNRFYYPDILLACEPDDDHEYYKQHPCLLVEVLSDSTEAIDRREKLHAYQAIPSLKEYVLIAQNKAQIETYRRASDHWQYILLNQTDDILHLECLGVDIPLPDVYEDVKFPE